MSRDNKLINESIINSQTTYNVISNNETQVDLNSSGLEDKKMTP